MGNLKSFGKILTIGFVLTTSYAIQAEKGSKNMLPQATNFPKDIHITIREIPPMKCIAYWDTGSSPEETVGKLMDKFIVENHIPNDPTRFTMFGHNNPMKGNPHGYELFLRIPDDFALKTTATVKELPGGLYAVVRAKGMDNIYKQAKTMVQWIQNNNTYGLNYPENFDMKRDPCPELEEIISEPGISPDKIVMDYYIPVKRK